MPGKLFTPEDAPKFITTLTFIIQVLVFLPTFGQSLYINLTHSCNLYQCIYYYSSKNQLRRSKKMWQKI